VTVAYAGLPGNQPASYGDHVFLWQSSIVPWNVKPQRAMPIPSDAESGSVVLDDVRITQASYTIGYSVGPRILDIAAMATVAAGAHVTAPSAVSLSLDNIGTTSLTVHYETLPGYLPGAAGNWIGLWTGMVNPYDAPDPIATVPIADNTNVGDVGINGIVLTVDTTYTLVYFMGSARTTAAAILTFDTTAATNP
jgi:hypothetical protein